MSVFFDAAVDPLFPMLCDIYYATETQDDYGMMKKSWRLDQTINCSFYLNKSRENHKDFAFGDEKFYKLESQLSGRTKTDVRQSSYGVYYPVSHILITNIRGGGCDEQLFFYETNDDYEKNPTVFSILMNQPFIGPYPSINYFSLELERSDIQELADIGIS